MKTTLKKLLQTKKQVKEDSYYPHRKLARDLLLKMDLPSRASEKYKFLPHKRLLSSPFNLDEQRIQTPIQRKGCGLFFINGKLCKNNLPDGIHLFNEKEAQKKFSFILNKYNHETLGKERDLFALLNHSYHQEAMLLYISEGVRIDEEITISHTITNSSDGVMPKLIIISSQQSKAKFKEEWHTPLEYLINSQLDFILEREAEVDYIKDDTSHLSDGDHIETIRGVIKRNAQLFLWSGGGQKRFQRQSIQMELAEEKARADVLGLFDLAKNKEMHTDICIKHLAEDTYSNQHYKMILREKSKAAFAGNIYVEKGADLTDAYQLSQFLLLDPSAKAYSKPNLEIYTDDVKASHGSTMKQFSEDELFYLTSRGITEEEVKTLLIKSFAKEMKDKLEK